MYTIQRIDLKMTADPDATKEENYYNSESEGKEFNRKEISKRLKQIYKEREELAEHFFQDYDEKYDAYVQATCEETFGKENCHEETYGEDFWQEYHNNTKEKKNNT